MQEQVEIIRASKAAALTRRALKLKTAKRIHIESLSELIREASSMGKTRVEFCLNTSLWSSNEFQNAMKCYKLSLESCYRIEQNWTIGWGELV